MQLSSLTSETRGPVAAMEKDMVGGSHGGGGGSNLGFGPPMLPGSLVRAVHALPLDKWEVSGWMAHVECESGNSNLEPFVSKGHQAGRNFRLPEERQGHNMGIRECTDSPQRRTRRI